MQQSVRSMIAPSVRKPTARRGFCPYVPSGHRRWAERVHDTGKYSSSTLFRCGQAREGKHQRRV